MFVVAVALASASLHHGIADGHVGETVLGFTLVFFAIYWAWVNFTWFASAFDTDDLVFRLTTFVTMVGALVFAAGVPRAVETLDFDVASYLHLVVFTSVAAVGAGLAVMLEHATHHAQIGASAAALSLAVPFAAYLLTLWTMYVRRSDPAVRRFGVPVVAVLLLGTAFTPWPVLSMGVLLVACLALKSAVGLPDHADERIAARRA